MNIKFRNYCVVLQFNKHNGMSSKKNTFCCFFAINYYCVHQYNEIICNQPSTVCTYLSVTYSQSTMLHLISPLTNKAQHVKSQINNLRVYVKCTWLIIYYFNIFCCHL